MSLEMKNSAQVVYETAFFLLYLLRQRADNGGVSRGREEAGGFKRIRSHPQSIAESHFLYSEPSVCGSSASRVARVCCMIVGHLVSETANSVPWLSSRMSCV